MNEIIFKIIFVILWFIYIAIRVPFESKYRLLQKIKVLDSKKEKLLIILLALGLLLIPLIWVFTPFLNSFNIELPIWVKWLGVVISTLSLFHFNLIHKTLGANWSPTLEIMEGHQLVKIGVYKRIRHPMYTQMFFWTVAQFLIISNLIAGLSGIVSWIIFYFVRVPREEKMMLEKFGDEYIEYKKQSGRIIPIRKRDNLR
jgi:protein-S-isoprenylcysteine O-methyltransferase Ste14